MDFNYCVYLLVHTQHSKTYVGMTNHLDRRIRQHNGEIQGGAKYTTRNKESGEWKIYGTIPQLNKQQALHLEKRIQIRSRTKQMRKFSSKPFERRLEAIRQILEEYNRIGSDSSMNVSFQLKNE